MVDPIEIFKAPIQGSGHISLAPQDGIEIQFDDPHLSGPQTLENRINHQAVMRPHIQIKIAGMVYRLRQFMQQPIDRIDAVGPSILEVFREAEGLDDPAASECEDGAVEA